MRGKHIFIITALISILMLAACGQKQLSYSRYGNRLNHYEERLRKAVKDRYGKDMLYEMMAQDVITKKYKVSEDDVDKEVQKLKVNTEIDSKTY